MLARPLACAAIGALVVSWLVPPCESWADDRSPASAVARMQVPEGMKVSLVASEPLVRQPVAIEFDDRGRLWVIQYLQYPNPEGLNRVQVDRYSRTVYDRVPEPPPRGPRGADRITILEDTDGDGLMDSSKEFVDGLNLATGMAHGHGGVFVLNVPYLLFYPDRNRDDIPDSDPEVLLTGFGMEDAHSVANSLCFGPDGWLYGCQGSTVTAKIRGIQFQQGVWRYHPKWDQFELFCEGGGNSWGLDFDARGQLLYSTNYGGYVLLHGVQGAYFVKAFAKHGPLHNPFAYGYFEHAAHQNFQGGHVTAGGVVYQADALPARFRNQYIAADLLAHNVNWHSIHAEGATFRTAHGGELLVSHDDWFAPCDVAVGPDGAIYVADWHDARTAHPDPDANWDRSNGRIYRIAPGDLPRIATDFATLTEEQLLELHWHSNQWYVRRARQELVRRGDFSLGARFRDLALTSQTESIALESLWTFHALCGLDESTVSDLLKSPHAAVREWTVRLLGDWVHLGRAAGESRQLSHELAHQLDRFAETEPELTVRQQLACTAARLPASQALPLINANIIRDVDGADGRLPLLWWWAVEKHCIDGREEVLKRFVRPSAWSSQLASNFLLPRLVRRYAAEGTGHGLDSVQQILASAPNEAARRQLWPAVLSGWLERVEPEAGEELDSEHGPRKFRQIASKHPLSQSILEAWRQLPEDFAIARLAIEFGHREPLEAVRRIAFDGETADMQRIEGLELLTQVNDLESVPRAAELFEAQASESVQLAVLGLLARSGDAQIASRLLAGYLRQLSPKLSERIEEILFSRRESARMFLEAVENGEVDARRISLEQARRVALLKDDQLNANVGRHWGKLQAIAPGEVLAEIRRLNNDLRASAGDPLAGKVLFNKHCANCHQLFGEGAKVGPDLTTANRKDRDFLLTSLVDPNNSIRAEYITWIIQSVDGRVHTGIPVARDDQGFTLVDSNGRGQRIEMGDVEEMQESPVSLMPQDLYKQFSPQQLRDLFAYLQGDG